MLLALLLIIGPIHAGPAPKPDFEEVTALGTVVELADVLKDKGIVADDVSGKQIVLRGEKDEVTPLLVDESSRAFFLDARLRGRKARLIGRRYPGLPYLQVTSYEVEDGGAMRVPEYFCDVCVFAVRYPQPCPCCQGELTLRMRPE